MGGGGAVPIHILEFGVDHEPLAGRGLGIEDAADPEALVEHDVIDVDLPGRVVDGGDLADDARGAADPDAELGVVDDQLRHGRAADSVLIRRAGALKPWAMAVRRSR